MISIKCVLSLPTCLESLTKFDTVDVVIRTKNMHFYLETLINIQVLLSFMRTRKNEECNNAYCAYRLFYFLGKSTNSAS